MSKNKKQNITIKKINIIVETNIEGEKPFSITYDKIYNPVKNKLVSSQKKLDYPFVTFDVKYDETVLYELNKKDYGELLRAFFDITYFTSMIKKMRDKNSNVDDKSNENNTVINHNIFMMLFFLFPIKYPTPNNITSSFNSKICNSPKEYTVALNRPNVQSSFFSTFFSRFKDIQQENIREYSYVNTSKGESTITQIIWLNDFLNEPRYRELVDTLIQYDEWLTNRKNTIDEDIENAQKDLFEKIGEDDVTITNEDIQMIIDQKKTNFSINTLIDNIKKYIKSLYVLPDIQYGSEEYEQLTDENIKKYIECLYSAERKLLDDFDEQMRKPYHEKNKNSSIFKRRDGELEATLIIEFLLSEKFGKNFKDFTGIFGNFENRIKVNHRARLKDTPNGIMDFYKESNDNIKIPDNYTLQLNDKLKKSKGAVKNIPTPLKPQPTQHATGQLIRLSSVDTDTKETCNDFRNNDEDIYNLRQELKNSKYFDKFKESIRNDVEKFNTFSANQGNARFIAQYRDVDNQIDKSVTELRNIMTITKGPSDLSEKNVLFKSIMNSVDFLKTFFSDESVRQNRLSGISSIQIKIEKIFKMTNEIKALQLTKTFFDKAKGINLYYDKDDKEQTKTNIELVTELKKDKYFYFTNTVKFIKEKFINSNRESTNTKLNKIMNTYFNNTSNDFIEKVIIPAKNAINENENIGCQDYFNTLVTKTRPSNDQKDPEYEINLYMEVIVGKIDYQNQQNITCNYRDQNLIQMYNELTSSPNEFEVLKKNNTVFLSNIIDNVKKDVTNIATENKVPSQAIPPAIPLTGGIRKRRTYKGRGKKMHKYTRKIH